MTCLHATEPASVYLSTFARADVSRSDIDRALYDDRTVVRQLAMRRTVFAFPVDLVPAVRGSASARVAGQLSHAPGQGGRRQGAHRGRRGLGRTRPARPCWPSCAAPATTAELRGADARTGPQARAGGRQELRRHVPGRAPGALDPGRRRPRGPRGERGRLEGLPAAVDRAASSGCPDLPRTAPGRRGVRRARARAGCGPSGRAPRPTWSGGWGRPRRAVRAALVDVGAVEVAARGRRAGLAAPRRPRRGGAAGAVGGAAACARPDHDGLEGPRVLPRRARGLGVRRQRQRRPERLVVRADRRRLAPGRRRHRARRPAADDARRGDAARCRWRPCA